ncbi:MAG: GyrI-like domain-containing protein [Planctomycetes bacterium]|nr:GyrI-like domain-containing protein [Planctomycetota bacterium]
MNYDVQLQNVSATRLLVVRRRATLPELKKVVPEACGAVWNYVRQAQVRSAGRLVAVYLNEHIDMEVGVEVGPEAVGAGDVIVSALPAGKVATVTHMGPYTLLPEVHKAIRQWCADHGHSPARPNWEIYGHGTDDPAKTRTDVFYLLEAEAKR